MNANISDLEFQKVQQFSQNYFSNKESYSFLINSNVQNQEIQKLNSGLREEQFFLIIDFLNLRINHSGGLQELGYINESFTLSDYFKMMPDSGFTSLLTVLGKQTFILSESNLISFLKPTFVALVPLKIYKNIDQLYLVKRSISPWQVTACGKITAYLSHFTIIKEYNYEELSPRIIGIPEKTRDLVMKNFNFNFIQQNVKENPFSPKEILILKMYLDSSLSMAQILNSLKISSFTLHEYNKSILSKTRKLFGIDIPIKTAKEAAIYLKKQGLLGI